MKNVCQPKSHIRCIDLVKEHFPPMHSMAMDEFWNPDSLCGVQSVCQQTTSNPGTTTGYMTLCFFIKGKGHILLGANLLQLTSLKDDPLALCNDGTPAVYYRNPLNSDGDIKKLLIFLKGGGWCIPNLHGIYITMAFIDNIT